MLNIISTSILWTLAIYGIIEIIRELISIVTKENTRLKNTYIIIAVKDNEENVEFFLRSTLYNLYNDNQELLENVIIADMGSNDNTSKIIEKLAKEYEPIKVMDWNNCKELLDECFN